MKTIKVAKTIVTACLTAILMLASYSSGFCESPRYAFLTVKHVRDITGGFNQPTEVAVSKTGKVYVLDGANNSVKIFNRKGEKLFSFGSPGTEPGNFRQPVGMAVDNDENIYVADTGNQRVQIFDNKGKLVRMIDMASMQARPVEVEYSAKTEKLYVSDTRNHQIHCFTKDGNLNFSWGKHGSKAGEFMYPGMSVADTDGAIYVVDILNGRLQIFDASGEDQRQLGKFGVLPGSFFRPKGVAFDGQSRIYVSDSYTGVIQLFDISGRLDAILSEDNTTPLRLTTPLGMAIDTDEKQLYVVQAELNKISVFAILDGK